jgi:nucleoside triphosphate pyrophosphatase
MTSFLQDGRPALILASSSGTRAKLLRAAGLSFSVQPPGLDEATMREALGGDDRLEPQDIAEVLARAKAEAVSDLAPEAYVIGADQILTLGNRVMGKCTAMAEARRRLLDLAGKSHSLHTAVAVARGGEAIWAYGDLATLTMRPVGPEFIGRYLAAAGDAVLQSVGCYQVEALGIELFETIEGSHFSILGLPLLPLLDQLRTCGAVEA